MAPVRRYLRISKFSVLECRIYLDNPALAQGWLLSPRDPVLPRVMECIRPLVLPKLREERERSRRKGSKKKGVKDVIETDEFEVSMFLTETSTRHSILTKHRHFRDKVPAKLQSNSRKLLGETSAEPIDIENAAHSPAVLLEEDDEEATPLDKIPDIGAADAGRGKRHRREVAGDDAPGSDFEDDGGGVDDDLEEAGRPDEPPSKRARQDSAGLGEDDEEEDKTKMAMDVSYEGFAIYGRVLCLVVKRRDTTPARGRAPRGVPTPAVAKPTGQAAMENWISSTQVPAGMEDEADTGS